MKPVPSATEEVLAYQLMVTLQAVGRFFLPRCGVVSFLDCSYSVDISSSENSVCSSGERQLDNISPPLIWVLVGAHVAYVVGIDGKPIQALMFDGVQVLQDIVEHVHCMWTQCPFPLSSLSLNNSVRSE